MKLYRPNKLYGIAVLFPLLLFGVMAYQGTVAVTDPNCGDPNVIERAIAGDYAVPGNSIACPTIKNAFTKPIPARDGCPADLMSAVNAGMVSAGYGGTCDALAKLVDYRMKSGVWPK